MELKKIQIVIGIIVGVITILGALYALSSFVATSEEVEEVKSSIEEEHAQMERTDALIAERMEIGIIEDRIYRQEQAKSNIEQRIVMQTAPREPTDAEKMVIREKEEEIKKLEKERSEKQRFYDELRKSR
jgi:uncharacterized membrane protein YhiD involved in acid resistance